MTDPKDGESFFRKVARFVANPATDWAEINSRQDDPEGELQKAELRAMVQRKRRNDFVRKRELDMLRRIRREGLTPEQLAALGSASSRMDELDRLGSNSEINSKIELGVKAKIDEIEQQMDGESFAPTQMQTAAGAHPPTSFDISTRAAHFAATLPMEPPAARVTAFASAAELERLGSAPLPAAAKMGAGMSPPSKAPPSSLPDIHSLPTLPMLLDELPAAPVSNPMDEPLSFTFTELMSPTARARPGNPGDFGNPGDPEVLPALAAWPSLSTQPTVDLHELVHDPELDEAVIAFANADPASCEHILTELIQVGGARHLHSETWLVLFDYYRATGMAAKFEALVLDYAQSFGLSAPQWFSMPKLVADAAKSVRAPMGKAGGVAWTAPDYLAADSVQQLQTRCQNLPMPWVLDWAPLKQIDIEACAELRALFRVWAGQQVDMRWLAGDQFLQLLKDLAPVAVRDVDPVLWMLRLEALRLVNRPDQFDETAIDYCVTYEVSPPSWERAKCRVRVSGQGLSTSAPGSTATAEVPTAFMESQTPELTPMSNSVQLELSGQLSGDISETLRLMTAELGTASVVIVACPKLIRLDFMAAGDLLNWVLSRKSENRTVIFTETHRLVALFFGAMGINEHAKVRVRQV